MTELYTENQAGNKGRQEQESPQKTGSNREKEHKSNQGNQSGNKKSDE